MRLKELKLMAGTIVVESKLTNDAKIQLLKFVKEASYFQTVALVLGDGIVSESKLNHDTLVERFNTEFDQGVLNEFIDEDQEGGKIERRGSNYLSYLLGDVIRHKLKVRNLGAAALPIFERELAFFKARGFEFKTCQQVYEQMRWQDAGQ